MLRQWFSSLRFRLGLLVVAAVLPGLFVAVYNYEVERRQAAGEAYADALRDARSVADRQNQFVENSRDLLAALALHPGVRALDPAACSEIARNLRGPLHTNIAVATPDGNVFCSAVLMTARVNIADRTDFRRAVQTRTFAVGEYQIGPITRLPALFVAYPLLDGSGRVRAVAYAALDLSQIGEALAGTTLHLPPGSTGMVLDASGTVLARHPDGDIWIGRRAVETPIFKAIQAAQGEGTVQIRGLDGRRRLYGFVTLPISRDTARLYVAVGIPVEVAFGPSAAKFTRFAAGLGAGLLVLFVLTWLTANSLILRPVGRVTSAADRMRRGDLSARSGMAGQPGELGRLARTFDEMAEAVEAQRELYETVTEAQSAMGEAIVVFERGERIIYANDAFDRLFGYTRDEIQSLPSVMTLVHPDERPKLEARLRRRLAGDLTTTLYETRAVHKDGHAVEIEIAANPVRRGETFLVVAIIRDIADRRRAEQDRLARESADAANRAKSEFLSRMSHELRTPLNVILGFGQLLEMDAGTPDQREGVEQILKAGRHLLELINEVLDIARIESGRLTISLEPVPVDHVLRETLDLVRPLAAQRGLRVRHTPIGDNVHVMADRQRLKQVLLNLFSNAVKFTPSGGDVSVSYTTDDERVRIQVADTGPGISAADLPRLFAPFERLGAEQAGIEGTGLGLALSKALMEAMDGAIGVDSRAGAGSTFWIELAATAPPVERAAAPSLPALPKAPRIQLTVLYIEDNISNLKLIERVMARRPDVRLITAMQGRLGLAMATEHHPDLILLDMHLPDVTGDVILGELKHNPATRNIPVVMLTATAQPGQIQRLLAAGAAAYLTKPVDVHALFRLLDEIEHGLPDEMGSA